MQSQDRLGEVRNNIRDFIHLAKSADEVTRVRIKNTVNEIFTCLLEQEESSIDPSNIAFFIGRFSKNQTLNRLGNVGERNMKDHNSRIKSLRKKLSLAQDNLEDMSVEELFGIIQNLSSGLDDTLDRIIYNEKPILDVNKIRIGRLVKVITHV
jgi:uncharacterized protein YeeX (DUF496 family)